MDVDAELPELRALASFFAGRGGALWAAEADGAVVGMIGVAPHPPAPGSPAGTWEIGRMYVRRDQRGSGLAQRLLRAAEQHARAQGAAALSLHTDTRFDRAHRFYEKHGYLREGAIRALNDLSNSIEFTYAKPIDGIVVMDAAAAASAERRLAEILHACVHAGASVSFMPPFPLDEARAFWRQVARGVACGERILLGAYAGGALLGTVTLDIAMPPNQPHHGAVRKLLVHPDARRRGLAGALMRGLEDQARAAGRRLLTLDTGDANAAHLYASQGWTRLGIIPGHALNPDGSFCDTSVFYKHLG
jgi:GNAT superfamily N-acetyltransferase